MVTSRNFVSVVVPLPAGPLALSQLLPPNRIVPLRPASAHVTALSEATRVGVGAGTACAEAAPNNTAPTTPTAPRPIAAIPTRVNENQRRIDSASGVPVPSKPAALRRPIEYFLPQSRTGLSSFRNRRTWPSSVRPGVGSV